MLRIEHHEYIFGHHSCTWNLLSASLSASLSANSRIATFDEERSRHAGTRSGWFRAYKQQLAAWLASVRSRYATKEDLSLLARIARGDPCPCVPGHACLFTITSTNKIVDRQRSTQSTTVDPRASTSACLESSFKSDVGDSRLDLSRALDSIRRAFRFKEDRDSRGGAAFSSRYEVVSWNCAVRRWFGGTGVFCRGFGNGGEEARVSFAREKFEKSSRLFSSRVFEFYRSRSSKIFRDGFERRLRVSRLSTERIIHTIFVR